MAGPTAPAVAGEGPGRLIHLQTADVTLTPGVYEVNGRHIVLQLDHNLQQAEVAALATSGVRLLSYLGDGAFIAGVDPGALTAGVRAAYDIRAATPWTVANKAMPALRRGEVDASAWTEAGLLEVVVLFFADMTEGEMTAILGRHAVAFQPETPPLLWSAEIAPAELAGLLGEQGIHVVKPGPVLFLPTLDNVRKIIHADEVQQATITDSGIQYAGLTGQGIHLQVSEFAWDGHPDFITKDGEWRFVDSNPEYGDIHGTLVGGIMAGDGELSATLVDTPAYAPLGQWRGIAPEATLIEFGAAGLEIDARHVVSMPLAKWATAAHEVGAWHGTINRLGLIVFYHNVPSERRLDDLRARVRPRRRQGENQLEVAVHADSILGHSFFTEVGRRWADAHDKRLPRREADAL